MSFIKETKDVALVSDYLFDDTNENPSVVAEKCFDLFLNEAKK